MRKITEIIVHCSATRPSWMGNRTASQKRDEIKKWHTEDRGWSDIGYHIVVDRDGTTVVGRPMERNGAHVRGRNTGTIGICLIGGHGSAESDKFSDHFTPAQAGILRTIIKNMREQYGAVPVSGHNQYAAKACPGFNVPRWLANAANVDPEPTEATRLRWRIAEIIKTGEAALNGD